MIRALEKTNGQGLSFQQERFRELALAYPSTIEAFLESCGSAEEVADEIDRASVYAEFARKIKEDAEVVNAVQYAKLQLIAALAAMLPRQPGKRTDKEETSHMPCGRLHENTLRRYRKVGDSRHRIEEYYGEIRKYNATADDPKEMGIDSFLRFVKQPVTVVFRQTDDEEEWDLEAACERAFQIITRLRERWQEDDLIALANLLISEGMAIKENLE